MNLHIKATNLELIPRLDDYIRKRAQSLEKLIPKEDTSADLYVEVARTTEHHKSGDVFRAEFNLHIAGKNIFTTFEGADIYAAIDLAKDEAVQVLRSHRGKQESRFRRAARRIKEMMRYPFSR
ncbi:MAG TPA: ribosome-associated translation inhibitor RaiA [Candidatus Paceibacterota bacterium]|nr:ribosome-associated translation inhibitor RaiA [Candidatus Paceibacterota bacterium]